MGELGSVAARRGRGGGLAGPRSAGLAPPCGCANHAAPAAARRRPPTPTHANDTMVAFRNSHRAGRAVGGRTGAGEAAAGLSGLATARPNPGRPAAPAGPRPTRGRTGDGMHSPAPAAAPIPGAPGGGGLESVWALSGDQGTVGRLGQATERDAARKEALATAHRAAAV